MVTGGAGFIGSHLIETLLRRGERVRILDNLQTGKKENLEEVTGYALPSSDNQEKKSYLQPLGDRAEFLFGDIADLETCRQACRGATHVFHLAALGSVQRSVEDPILSHRANATGTLHLLQAAKEMKIKRVVYASSSSVYGNISSNPDELIPKSESLPTHPQSPYAATKLMGEYYCEIFFHLYNLETVCLRFFNVFGPRQDPRSIYAAVIPKFITALLAYQAPVIYGDGCQSRDFTYVENVVQASLLAMKQAGVAGNVFNIACGQQTSINELLLRLQEISGRESPARFEEARSGEVRHSLAAIDLAKARLGYEVKVGLREGLTLTWDWFQRRKG